MSNPNATGAQENATNYETFREVLSDIVISKFLEEPKKSPKARKRKGISVEKIELDQPNDAEDLADFIDFLASEVFDSLPSEFQTISFPITQEKPNLLDQLTSRLSIEHLSDHLPASVTDSLTAYTLPAPLPLLTTALPAYLTTATAPPPIWSDTRPAACELCHRDWIPLTYHHLIPRSTHKKAVQRNWHPKDQLNKVAWLCGACHRCVHRVAGNEELARSFHTLEALRGRDDVRRFAEWVGGVRWKKR